MADEPVEYETREVQASVKEGVTVYDRAVIDAVEGNLEEPLIGEPRTVTYACGHDLVQTDRMVLPARCPHCGGPLYE